MGGHTTQGDHTTQGEDKPRPVLVLAGGGAVALREDALPEAVPGCDSNRVLIAFASKELEEKG